MNNIKKISDLKGFFQLKNLSMAALAAKLCGFKKRRFIHQLEKLKT